MNIQQTVLIEGLWLGLLATALFDGGLFLQRQWGVRTLNFAYLGRWIGHFKQLKYMHDNIGQAPALAHEWLIGVLGHYAIGVFIAELLLLAEGAAWMLTPAILPALVVGMLTVAFPLLIMQPGMGAGVAFSNTPRPCSNSLKSLLNHTVFGVCLYAAAELIRVIRLIWF
ncbi:DUF2938 family protein [Methylophilus sp. 5]|uniref:DUF2938 family protein n=1 Tax=Methylophilus sp. 5 TaxID=1112274 RepID=UPI00048EAF37|nr:DUF2938 family protein [Methylophilus sp. 5]